MGASIFCHTWQCLPGKSFSIWSAPKFNISKENHPPLKKPISSNKKSREKAPSGSLYCGCYTISPLQEHSRHQTILKQVLSCRRWEPPALDSSLTPCDELGNSRFGPPHTHSSKYLGTLTGFLEENEPASFSKNRRKLEQRLHSRTLGRTISATQTVKSDPYILVLSAKP